MSPSSPHRFLGATLVVAVHLALLLVLLRPAPVPSPADVVTLEAVNIAVPPPPEPPPAKHPAPDPSAPVARVPAAPAPLNPAPPAPEGVAATGAPGGSASGGGSGGSGAGGGGITRARWASGSITNRDYPKAARKAGVGGAVTVHFDVRADGRVENCRVMVSSGAALLDESTCQLIEARFRYTPARDSNGTAVPDIAGWKQDWWLSSPN